MSNMDEARTKFEAEYCPPLDPALLYSILYDFDLNVENDRVAAKNILDPLRESALLQEAIEFDTSGSTDQGDGSEVEARSNSRLEGSAASSRGTDITSLSNGLGEFDLSDDGTLTPDSASVDLETMDESTKTALLLQVFKDKVTAYNVRYTLQKCNGEFEAAMEELLNQVGISEFMQGEDDIKLSNKSVDAFAEENGFRRGRKSKGKKKNQRASRQSHSGSNPGSPIEASLPLENKWQTTERDVAFVAGRTSLAPASIMSLHNSLGASLPKTITAILERRLQQISQEDREDPVMVSNAYDLQQDFPAVEYEYIFALIHITKPSTAAAHELARALTPRTKSPTAAGIQIIPRYTRPALDETEPTWHEPRKGSRVATPTDYCFDASNASSVASMHKAASAIAREKAQAAYRKSKSNHLFGGAAGYYSEQGRELSALSSQATARAADQLAARQSTSTEVDLHGIDVLNGIRIAQERVAHWFQSLGENRVNGRVGAGTRQAGYRIVVGLGTHSVGGKSRLGPAVSKALKSQGWKIENQGAVILVKGR